MWDKDWYKEGLQFECQGSGKCCSSRGEYGYVYLNLKDRQRMAKSLGLSTASFTKKYCSKNNGFYHLNDNPKSPDCIFLKDNKCNVYEGRPTQCRTWPFWPEVMNPKSWSQEVVAFCPGAGKGKTYSQEEIDKKIVTQIQAELEA